MNIREADATQRHFQSIANIRELTHGGAMVTWKPTDDPRELVRRQAFLDADGNTIMTSGDVRISALREFCSALARELEGHS